MVEDGRRALGAPDSDSHKKYENFSQSSPPTRRMTI
jgi:hypothetical protein